MKKRWALSVLAILLVAAMILPETAGNRAKAASQTISTGDTVTFGSYPQTRVTDAALLSSLASTVSGKTFTAYPYCSKNPEYSVGSGYPTHRDTSMMSYCDFNYGGKKYRAVKISKYRPQNSESEPGTNTRQSINGFAEGETYFFLWEPIEWIVLDASKGLLLSKYGLDAQPFAEYYYDSAGELRSAKDTTYYANDYFYSPIRDWLTKPSDAKSPYTTFNFINKAFTTSEQGAMQTTKLSNSHGGYVNDKLFLLSSDEFNTYKNTSGFTSGKNTDYALSQNGAKGENANWSWWLRTEMQYSTNRVNRAKGTSFGASDVDFSRISSSLCGVRPAVKVDLTSSYVKVAAPEIPAFSVTNSTSDVECLTPKVQWSAATGATSYKILRYAYGSTTTVPARTSSSWVTVATVSASASRTYNDSSAVPGKKYAYAVRAIGNGWEADSTNYVNRNVHFAKVTNAKATFNRNKMNFTISWNHTVPSSISSSTVYIIFEDDSIVTSVSCSGGTSYSLTYPEEIPYGETRTIKIVVGIRGNSAFNSDPVQLTLTVPRRRMILFDTVGGSMSTNGFWVLDGEVATIPTVDQVAPPTKRGYYFLGWSMDPNNATYIYKSGDSIGTVYGTVYLYAVWQARKYKITYNLDGGTNNSANPSRYTVESPAIYLKPATKSGYRFDGWYTDAAKTKKSSGIAPDSIGDRTFYAKFTKLADVKLSFSRNGGTGNAPAAQTVPYGTTVTIPKIYPTREGYYYLGWSTNKNATAAQYKGGDKITVTENTVLHAVWKPRTNTITFNANGGSGTLPTTIKVLSGKTATIGSSSMSRNGYWFLGWSASNTATTATYKTGSEISVLKDTVLYAVWKKK
ncbi:MAG: InlB B-repeat-containing protein [Lachnospiraceae bacterium]|nr:InlB B-repeat-containing protein [Lachnospiraceae bacterium]